MEPGSLLDMALQRRRLVHRANEFEELAEMVSAGGAELGDEASGPKHGYSRIHILKVSKIDIF